VRVSGAGSSAGAARARLRARFAAVPALVRQTLEAPLPALPFDPRALRRVRVTGIGASESHARALAWLLAERLELDAHYTPAGALLSGRLEGCERDALVVFSQGLSPNARFALSAPGCWRGVLLVTAVSRTGAGAERAAWLDALESAGVGFVRFPPENEYDSLVRVQGPLTGLAAALGVARAFGFALGRDDAVESAAPAEVGARIAAAEPTLEAALAGTSSAALERMRVLLASGGYTALCSNLRLKLLEGLLEPLPPAWDLLEFAHGPFQQCFEDPLCLLLLSRRDAPEESLWLARLREMLEPDRHALVTLPATLPGLYALFEHDALLDALMLRLQDARGADPSSWPGRGREAPLFEASPRPESVAAAGEASAGAGARELAGLRWPELEPALARGATAVVPLGALEQHGPHLPFATDAWIADALAARVCARVPGCVALPALAFGCSPEHAAFPGTLSLREQTFAAVLADLVASLARHGFARVFLFSAHGGNAAPLRAALPDLQAAARDAAALHGRPAPRVLAHADLAGLTGALQRAAAAQGIGPAEAGHHAGEVETSLLLALRPGAVRRDAFAPGRLAPQRDAQALFYPDLRANAPDGTVGDPRPADAARGARYLETWTDELVACLERDAAP
jgi:creatinine amidohydrolase